MDANIDVFTLSIGVWIGSYSQNPNLPVYNSNACILFVLPYTDIFKSMIYIDTEGGAMFATYNAGIASWVKVV